MTPLRTVQTVFTLRVRAIDTGGNVTETSVATYQVTADATAPTVVGVTPRDGSQVNLGINAVAATFNEPVAPASVTTSNFRLFRAGADGIAGNGDDVAVPAAAVTLSQQDRTALLTMASPLAADLYRGVMGAGVADAVGNVSSATTAWTFRVVLGNLAGGDDFTINGSITTPGGEQTWSFLGNAGQRVFFDGQNPCGFGFQDLRYTVTDPAGVVFINAASLSGCALDEGTKVLPLAGVYRVRVFGAGSATGSYVLKVWNVPTPVPVPIALNQTVSIGVPAAGAGNIARPGESDVYTIALTAGQKVYADGANPCGFGFQDLRWTLRASNGTVVFPIAPSGNTLGQLSGCVADVGEVTIPATGTYTLAVVGNDEVTRATYTATLWNANPPVPVAIALNQTISNGAPVAGAGNIETPGKPTSIQSR